MKNRKPFRLGGTLTAAVMLLTQISALQGTAAKNAGKEIDACDYYMTTDAIKVERGKPVEFKTSELGVPAGAVVKEVWIDMSADTTKKLPTMPAFGYYAKGCGEYDWYSDGLWMQTPAAQAVVSFPVSEDYAMPSSFQIQCWGEEGESLDYFTLNAVGVCVEGGTSNDPDIGMVTRKGDVNMSKKVDQDDVTELVNYLTKESEIKSAANADLDGSKQLNAIDLTLLKRGIIDGSLNPAIEDNNETAMEFVNHIKLGWNLGNTLDAQGYYSPTMQDAATYEECWGNPTTTKKMIDAVKAAGFNTVRIPVSWGAKMDKNTYQISESWMNRVQQVVNYVIENDMYCILNIHHDNTDFDYETKIHHYPDFPYFYPDSAHYEQSEKFVTAVWSQVADRFESYDSHLIFETLNEPRLVAHNNEWWIDPSNSDCQDAMNCVNKLNAAALSSIRKTGGNNAKRFVMMPTYSASPDPANLDGFKMPDDNHLIAEIHAYRPYDFALRNDGQGVSTFNETTDKAELIEMFNNLKSRFISKGIPVIIDEFGAMNRDNEDQRAAWAKCYLTLADSYGIPCVWWDNNLFSGNGEQFGLLNRSSCQIEYPKIMAAMVEATKNRG
ncbi:MAG: cellulase family glycosylhydrolase [Oscillospiraceae bacterium]|nr:cellulase family glycosylhydrolase [Oscillospiraceae bacterium]